MKCCAYDGDGQLTQLLHVLGMLLFLLLKTKRESLNETHKNLQEVQCSL